MMTLLSMPGSGDCGMMTCGPGPGMSKLIVWEPGTSLAYTMALRSEPSPTSLVLRTMSGLGSTSTVTMAESVNPMELVTTTVRLNCGVSVGSNWLLSATSSWLPDSDKANAPPPVPLPSVITGNSGRLLLGSEASTVPTSVPLGLNSCTLNS